jgi:hypothetical protein
MSPVEVSVYFETFLGWMAAFAGNHHAAHSLRHSEKPQKTAKHSSSGASLIVKKVQCVGFTTRAVVA